MKKSAVFAALALSFASVLIAPVFSQAIASSTPVYANKHVIDSAVNSKDHATLVAAVKVAGSTQSNGVVPVIDRVLLPG